MYRRRSAPKKALAGLELEVLGERQGEERATTPRSSVSPASKKKMVSLFARRDRSSDGVQTKNLIALPGPPLRFEVIDKLASAIEQKGLQHPGLFRIPGDAVRAAELYETFYLDIDIIPIFDSKYMINDIGDAFKRYLREQKESMLPHEDYARFVTVLNLMCGFNGGDKDASDTQSIEILIQLCQKMPTRFKPIFRRVLRLLWRVNQYSEKNKMGAYNLSTIFGPCFVKADEESTNMMELFEQSKEGVELCKLLILNSNTLTSVLPIGLGPFYKAIGTPRELLKWKIKRLVAISPPKQLHQAGDTIQQSKDTSNDIIFISSGFVRVSLGGTFITGAPGDFFGYVGLLGADTSITRITCSTPCKIVKIPRRVFEIILDADKDFRRMFYWKQANTLAKFIDRVYCRANCTTNTVISSVKKQYIVEANVRLLVHFEEAIPVIICLNNQDKISDVIYHAVVKLDIPILPSDLLLCKEGETEALPEEERIQILLADESKTKEATVRLVRARLDQPSYIITRRRTRKGGPHRRRSKSVDPTQSFEAIAEYSTLSRSKILQLAASSLLLTHRTVATLKERKFLLPYNTFHMESHPEENFGIRFVPQNDNKIHSFVFQEEQQYLEALRIIQVQSTEVVQTQVADIWPIDRCIIKDNYEISGLNLLTTKPGDLVLLTSQKLGESRVEFAGCSEYVSSSVLDIVVEPKQNTFLVQQKCFSCRALVHLPVPKMWNIIFEYAKNLSFNVGETIVEQGESKQHLFILMHGTCGVVRDMDSKDGRCTESIQQRVLEEGDMFGVESFLLGGASRYSVVAHSSCSVVYLCPAKSQRIFSLYVELGASFMKYLAGVLFALLSTSLERVRFLESK